LQHENLRLSWHLGLFGARGDQWHRTGRATDREVWTVRGTRILGDTRPSMGPYGPEVKAPRATQSMPRGFESTSAVKPRSLRVVRFIGGRSIVASISATNAMLALRNVLAAL